MTDLQILIVALAVPASFYLFYMMAVVHAAIGRGAMKTHWSWRFAFFGIMILQLGAAVTLLDAVFG